MQLSKILIFVIALSIYHFDIAAEEQPVCCSSNDIVYLMTNKTIYETSEDLWFKAFVFERDSNYLSNTDQTLYLQIVNSSDSVVWKEMYPLSGGMGAGQIYVGDNWTSGEYLIQGFTKSSIDKNMSSIFPQRITVVNELRDFPKLAKSSGNDKVSYINPDSIINLKRSDLRISLTIDSAAFSPRSIIPLCISVCDSIGKPVKANMVISVSDALYYNPNIDNDIISYLSMCRQFDKNNGKHHLRFLSDGIVGEEIIGSKKMSKKTSSIGEQWLNIFSDGGLPVFVNTSDEGKFEIESSIMREMDHFFYIKPVSGKEFKPQLRVEHPFDSITFYTKNSKRIALIINSQDITEQSEDDNNSYAGRGSIKLPEVDVYAKVRYPKRQKLIGYLDSISSMSGGAWVCGCDAGVGASYLNDYKQGYTHHPEWSNDYQPKEHSKPIKGKRYLMIKYLPGGDKGRGYVADIKEKVWEGDEYTEEELLRMNNLWKVTGYYKSPEFPITDEAEIYSSLDDIRNTLLWIPNAMTDQQGYYQTNIIASDICSQFIINILAITSDGQIGTYTNIINITALSFKL